MNRERFYTILKSDYLKLVPILALAAYIAFIPHIDYPYPVHLDEWSRMAEAKATMKAGDATIGGSLYWGPLTTGHPPIEAGFRMSLGIFKTITGIPWITVFRYLPSMIFMLTILCAYLLGRRWGAGWEAALMTCFMPTTVGILGPAFLVPVALGLPFILLSTHIAFNYKGIWSYFVLFLLMCFIILMHPPTAIGLAILMAPYLLFNLKGRFRHALGAGFGLYSPFIVVLLVFGIHQTRQLVHRNIISESAEYISWPNLMSDYGYLPMLLCLVGVLFLVKKGTKEGYGLLSGFVVLLVVLVIYIRFGHGLEIIYSRGLLYAMLIMGIIGGFGLCGIKQLQLPDLSAGAKRAVIGRKVGWMGCLILIIFALALVIPSRQDTYYYHMIDEEDYQAFTWIRNNVDDYYHRGILDPWKATAFVAITERNVRGARITAHPDERDNEAYNFLEAGCVNTGFLRKRKITIVYTRQGCNNPDLTKIREYVYLFEK